MRLEYKMAEKYVRAYTKGLYSRLEAESIPEDSASDSLNWQTYGDHIELRRGQTLLGTEDVAVGNISGLFVGERFDGTQVLFHSVDRKIKYYDTVTSDWIEVSTADILSIGASGEDVSFDQYQSLAGSFVYLSSKNSGIYKIPVANPASIINLSSDTFRGKIRIKQNRMFLWDRKDSSGGLDPSGFYGSYIDKDELSDYPNTLGETVGTGDGITPTFTGTLNVKKGTAGTGTITSSGTAITGVGTLFTTELVVGGSITVGKQSRIISAITSTTALTITTAFTPEVTAVPFTIGNPKATVMYVRVAGQTQAGTTITAITQGSVAKVTSTAHGLAEGDNIIIYGVVGMTQINNLIANVYAVIDANTVYVNIATTSYTAYSSAGTIAKVEILNDGRNGTLTGRYAGTGTINYATGAVSATFNTIPPVSTPIVVDYYWEDSTNQGIADFTKSTPRTAGQGFTFRQDDGGAEMQNVFTFESEEYTMHKTKTWKVTLSSDDTQATNLSYRDNVGLPYWRAGCETADGIYYADAPDTSEPYIRVLAPNQLNTKLLPSAISDQLDLKNYYFDKCVIKDWSNYVVVACRSIGSTVNDTVFLYNRLFKIWDKFDYRVGCLAILNGTLVAGDSASKNVFTLFSGLTDEEVEIPNRWVSNATYLGSEGIKYSNIFQINGLIQDDQEFEIWLSYDNGEFVKVKTLNGQGSYVDHTQKVDVGSNTLGSKEVGGGGTGIEASPYNYEFRVNTPKFEKIRVKFIATKVGYLSISKFGFKDIRRKGKYLPSQYVEN